VYQTFYLNLDPAGISLNDYPISEAVLQTKNMVTTNSLTPPPNIIKAFSNQDNNTENIYQILLCS
jgi:hypothetical protein